jgi:hypothetical protein
MFHLAPTVKNYLETLPCRHGGTAVVSSTYGEVCSGGLHAQAARILKRKGYAAAMGMLPNLSAAEKAALTFLPLMKRMIAEAPTVRFLF